MADEQTEDGGRKLTQAIFGELFPKSLSELPSDALTGGDFSRLSKNVASIDASLEIDANIEYPAGVRLRRELASTLRVSLQEKVTFNIGDWVNISKFKLSYLLADSFGSTIAPNAAQEPEPSPTSDDSSDENDQQTGKW